MGNRWEHRLDHPRLTNMIYHMAAQDKKITPRTVHAQWGQGRSLNAISGEMGRLAN